MSRSMVACAVDALESSVVRLKTSGGDGFILSGCRTVPAGFRELTSPKGQRTLKRLAAHAAKWAGEPLALTVAYDTYHPLPALFPAGATAEECAGCSRLEASYFLSEPDRYRCDILPFTTEAEEGAHERKLLVFWPEAARGSIARAFEERHGLSLESTPVKTAVGMSKLSAEPTVLLELESGHLLLLVASGGAVEHFSHRQVRNRDESRYFALRELSEAGLPAGTPVQLRGELADRAMRELIKHESGFEPTAQALPPTISVSGMSKSVASSPSALVAIMTAIQALG
ncbi:hypothetical protein [Chlorobium sp. N1]|uniref:hypothetical protein n=1 Tax=Chlorobium sp. N1 TaxID=2491138 RepID=UPI00103D7B49|nr:hypothetical protein [Chlorobium sp. N1]TCD47857.1 hypothetical protein E0L29_06135 [Chlorobium sp. N1]